MKTTFHNAWGPLTHQTEQGVNIPTTQGSDTSAPAEFIIETEVSIKQQKVSRV